MPLPGRVAGAMELMVTPWDVTHCMKGACSSSGGALGLGLGRLRLREGIDVQSELW